VVAIGQPEMVKGDWIKPGAVVIDCGINSLSGMNFDSVVIFILLSLNLLFCVIFFYIYLAI
jgi:hypothetical protein